MNKTAERQKYLFNKACDLGYISIAETAFELGVSVETIRRDIIVLCKDGKLERVRGGAVPLESPFRKDSEYFLRIQERKEGKRTIGYRAATMVKSGDVVALDCGTSIQEVATNIRDVENVTFIVNSIPIANILMHKMENGEISGRIIMIPGEIDEKNRFTKGAMATDMVDKFNYDIAFLSCTAISANGVSQYTLDEGMYSRHLIDHASQCVLVAESDKFGKRSLYEYSKISDFDYIITERKTKITAELSRIIKQSKTELIIISL